MEKLNKKYDPTSGHSGTEWLQRARDENDEKRFKSLINSILPALRNYIGRRLNLAHSTGLIQRNRLRAEEIIDLVYIRLYEEFEKSVGDDLETWVFRVADELLEQQLKEEAFEREHWVELQAFEELELSGLEEKFSTDAEGELIMDEELDDISYKHETFDPLRFIADTDTLDNIESVFSEFDKKRMYDEIQRQLISLPEEERSVFDLFWIVGLSMAQISRIRKLPVARIEKILKKVGGHIRKKLSGQKDN